MISTYDDEIDTITQIDGVYKTQTSYTSTGHGYLRINLNNNNNGASQVTFRAKNIRIK